MENIKIDINAARGENFLSLTAQISEEEADRLTAENRLFVQEDLEGNLWIINVPFATMGTLQEK